MLTLLYKQVKIGHKTLIMMTHLSKIKTGLLLACMFLSLNTVVAQTVTTQTAAEQQIKKASELTERIASTAKLTDEQKTKVQASVLEALVKFNDALQKAKSDESKTARITADLLADINARLKTILTPDQYTKVTGEQHN
jgi:hypothetical protein